MSGCEFEIYENDLKYTDIYKTERSTQDMIWWKNPSLQQTYFQAKDI